MSATVEVIRQHLIDPEICIRCNTCEETCPVDAVTHDARNYVVDVDKCTGCNECISPCPTGAIDNWRQVERTDAYTLEEQFSWDSLPPQREIAADAGSRAADRRRADHGARDGGTGRHGGAAVVGGASVCQSLHDRQAGDRDRVTATSG